jgi:anti-sigma regulatory factor (Ser/Thr protein kinase)
MERASGVHERSEGSTRPESARPRVRDRAFRHTAFLYSGSDGFVDGAAPFVTAALDASEAVLVAVATDRQLALHEALGRDASGVVFADVTTLGGNPARLIPAWTRFLEEFGGEGREVHVIAEPLWPGRTSAELAECTRYEGLLNVAFEGGPSWRLLCPYDVDALEESVLEAASATHPIVRRDGRDGPSATYVSAAAVRPLAGELPRPPAQTKSLRFTIASLHELREFVGHVALTEKLGEVRTENLRLAVNELASNSVRHGGGEGVLKTWADERALVCEVSDGGMIEERLVGQVHPSPEQQSGRGLWLVNQLCDLVQIRSGASGTLVRVHMRLDERS